MHCVINEHKQLFINALSCDKTHFAGHFFENHSMSIYLLMSTKDGLISHN